MKGTNSRDYRLSLGQSVAESYNGHFVDGMRLNLLHYVGLRRI